MCEKCARLTLRRRRVLRDRRRRCRFRHRAARRWPQLHRARPPVPPVDRCRQRRRRQTRRRRRRRRCYCCRHHRCRRCYCWTRLARDASDDACDARRRRRRVSTTDDDDAPRPCVAGHAIDSD